MDLNQYRELYDAESGDAPGWDAIDSRLREVYGSQEPRHWGTLIRAMLGGPEVDWKKSHLLQCADDDRMRRYFIDPFDGAD